MLIQNDSNSEKNEKKNHVNYIFIFEKKLHIYYL